MYPVLFRIGSYEVTSFGLMVAIGAGLGVLLLRHELGRRGLDVSAGTDAALIGVLGGLLGAKLLYVFEHFGEGLGETLFSRGGMSWFGGLVGGVVAGLIVIAWKRLPVMALLAAAAPAITLGQGVGRIGCFLVGDDYGRPTALPWGVAFPQGLPPTLDRVHPTQIYEALALFAFTWLLVRWRRRGVGDLSLFGRYLVLVGATRFLIELVRVNIRVALGLTVAQFFALGAVGLGVAFLLLARARGARLAVVSKR
jgi:phosphatidylglycerol:prolipoprotein diacylglycerol transferase